MQERRLRIRGESWRIIIVYSNQEMEKRKGDIERWVQEEKEVIYIGGDFNARTGSEGSLRRGMERYSKDRVVNKKERELLQLC